MDSKDSLIEEAIAFLNCIGYKWEHSGAMNATALMEKDRYDLLRKHLADYLTRVSIPSCPQCGKPLQKVTQSERSLLNTDQFDASRAGDYYCKVCPSNGRGKLLYCYWWQHETVLKKEDKP